MRSEPLGMRGGGQRIGEVHPDVSTCKVRAGWRIYGRERTDRGRRKGAPARSSIRAFPSVEHEPETYLSMQQRIVNQRLLASARRADPEAIEALYHAFSESLYLTALRITRSHQDAEDVLHDLFVGLPQKLSTFESRGNFEGWLRKVAVRTALMVVRRRSRTLPPPPPAVRRTRTEERMITQLDLAAALEQLPQTYREVFVLKAIEGYSHSEIAETLGITESNSMVRLHRARSTLRDLLEGAR